MSKYVIIDCDGASCIQIGRRGAASLAFEGDLSHTAVVRQLTESGWEAKDDQHFCPICTEKATVGGGEKRLGTYSDCPECGGVEFYKNGTKLECAALRADPDDIHSPIYRGCGWKGEGHTDPNYTEVIPREGGK